MSSRKSINETRKWRINNLYSRIWQEEILEYSEIEIYSSTNVSIYLSRMEESFRYTIHHFGHQFNLIIHKLKRWKPWLRIFQLELPGRTEWRYQTSRIVSELHCKLNGKTAGQERITYDSLKQGFVVIFSYNLDIFTFCFNNGILPQTWKNCYVKTLFKGKGSKADADIYRVISLLSCVYKIQTGKIYSHIRIQVALFGTNTVQLPERALNDTSCELPQINHIESYS